MDISSRKEVKQQIQDFTSTDRLGSDQFDLVYGRKLKSPVLGHHYQSPDLPTNYLPPTILDTSLLHVRFNNNISRKINRILFII